MTQSSEAQLLDFLKKADSPAEADVYPDPAGTEAPNTEAVTFSDEAQETSQDVREGVVDRLFDHKSKSDVAERALVGAVLSEKDLETSSLQLQPVEKVSHPTLSERVLGTFGRL